VTVLTMSTRPGPDTSLRPVPWRRMAWVTWRQHQLTLAGVGALLGAAAVYLLITGLRIHHAYAAVTACRPASSGICRQVANNFLNTYAPGAGVTAALLQVVPALIGAFAGAPVLAREFETGTFRYAWTQGFGRVRWTVAKLVPLAVAVTVAAAAFSVLFSWYYRPIIGAGGRGPLAPATLPLTTWCAIAVVDRGHRVAHGTGRTVIMRGCLDHHGPVRPSPILSSPDCRGNTWAT
jgi:hypothetical protein